MNTGTPKPPPQVSMTSAVEAIKSAVARQVAVRQAVVDAADQLASERKQPGAGTVEQKTPAAGAGS